MITQRDAGRFTQAHGTAAIVVRQTAASAAGSIVWGLWSGGTNFGTRTIFVTRLVFQLSFDGTGAATLMRYEWIKATGVTALTGGVLVTPSLFKTGYGAETAAVVRVLDTGLTATGAVFGGPVSNVTWARTTPSTTQAGGISDLITYDFVNHPLELGSIVTPASGELLALRVGPTNAAVIGDTVLGHVEFFEQDK